jgi:hypothetical protein
MKDFIEAVQSLQIARWSGPRLLRRHELLRDAPKSQTARETIFVEDVGKQNNLAFVGIMVDLTLQNHKLRC